MIAEYFRESKKKLEEKNTVIDQRVEDIHREKLENQKFQEMLRKEGDVFFADFTPRDINNKNIAKIRELEQEFEDLKNEESDLKSKRMENEGRISVIIDCLEEYRDLKKAQIKKDEVSGELDQLRETIKSYESKMEMLDSHGSDRGKQSSNEKVDEQTTEHYEEASEPTQDDDFLKKNEKMSGKSDRAKLKMAKRTIGRILNLLPTAPMRARVELGKLQREL